MTCTEVLIEICTRTKDSKLLVRFYFAAIIIVMSLSYQIQSNENRLLNLTLSRSMQTPKVTMCLSNTYNGFIRVSAISSFKSFCN